MKTKPNLIQQIHKFFGSYNDIDHAAPRIAAVCAALFLVIQLFTSFYCDPKTWQYTDCNIIGRMCYNIANAGSTNIGNIFDIINIEEQNTTDAYQRLARYCTGLGKSQSKKITDSAEMVNGKLEAEYHFEYSVTTADEFVRNLSSAGSVAIKTIAIIWFIIRLTSMALQKILDGHDAVEGWLMTAIKASIGIAVILKADQLVSALFYLIFCAGNQFTTSGVGKESWVIVKDDSAYNLFNAVTKGATLNGSTDPTASFGLHLWTYIPATLELMFPNLIAGVVKLATNFIIWQILIELGLRRLFLPIPIMDTYQEGIRSPGVRYIKKMLALVFRFILIACISLIVAKFMEIPSVKDGNVDVTLSVLGGVTSLGLMFKTGEIANDIIGV